MNSAEPSTTPLRLLTLFVVCIGVLAIFTIAFVDGPEPSHAFLDVISVHDSMIPSHTAVQLPGNEGVPLFEGELAASESGMEFRTWLFRWNGRWASVHAFDGSFDPPPNSRVLTPERPERVTFEAGDLSLISWEIGNKTWVIAGSDDARSLLVLSGLVIEQGIESLSRQTPAPGGPPSGAAPESAPPQQ